MPPASYHPSPSELLQPLAKMLGRQSKKACLGSPLRNDSHHTFKSSSPPSLSADPFPTTTRITYKSMKLLNRLHWSISLGALAVTPFTFAQNTPLLTNTDFSSGFDGWIAGSNLIVGGAWQSFAQAPDAFTFESRVAPSGSGYTFTSWDDGASDTLENFFFQEFRAGPFDSIFQPGDVIRFTGNASAVVQGADTSDMKVRAFIKTLGFNELGWENQIQDAYTVYHDITDTLGAFDLSLTFPDTVTADPFQVIQLGFEITVTFDTTTLEMDRGTIFFENIAGFVDGGGDTWQGLPVDANGLVDTGTKLGLINVTFDPWFYSYTLERFFYSGTYSPANAGNWMYLLR